MPAICKILVPTDFSPTADVAAHRALELATSLGASLTLLHVYTAEARTTPDGGAWIPTAHQVATRMALAVGGLETAAARLQPSAVPVSTLCCEGAPATEIARVARDGGFDLIVMGTHGRRGAARLVLGSVTETVMRIADCPVLTVREPEAARPATWPPVL